MKYDFLDENQELQYYVYKYVIKNIKKFKNIIYISLLRSNIISESFNFYDDNGLLFETGYNKIELMLIQKQRIISDNHFMDLICDVTFKLNVLTLKYMLILAEKMLKKELREYFENPKYLTKWTNKGYQIEEYLEIYY